MAQCREWNESGFKAWMKAVDALLVNAIGLTHEDMADWHWADAYEDGMSAQDAMAEFAEDEGIEFAIRQS